ncbi:MAG: class I SAM-dependent methyltransferase [Desulfamplus sp.]|nr:class I SAM-dependent methyltransferase [Desulfamplus sp.]
MQQFIKTIVRTPFVGYAILFIFRAKTAIGYFIGILSNLLKWLFRSNETTNFTYNLEQKNTHYLASLIADIANIEFSVVMDYIKEIEEDMELRSHIANATEKSSLSFLADKDVRFGRRIGWYAFVRVLKPKTVIETGVDKGLGACVLTAALMKNKQDGYEGRYYGTDINREAGYLLSGDYANYGEILYGDSIESLINYEGMIDLFVNDSDHSADYEAEEYKTIANKLSEHAIVLGDNSHVTDKLLEFSLETNRHFIFFQEKPHEHWYPGAGIGISFLRPRTSNG